MASILRVLAALFLLALPAAAARPAAAAPAETTIQPLLGTLTLAPGSSEKLTLLWLKVTAPQTAEHHVTLALDYSDVTSFATVDFVLTNVASDSSLTSKATGKTTSKSTSKGTSEAASAGPCKLSGTTFNCEWDDLIYDSDSQLSYAGLVSATPKSSATTGKEGVIRVTTKVDDGAATSSTGTVRVGEAVDLAAGEEQEISVAAGGSASANPVVQNVGNADVNGTVMVLAANPALLASTNYSNCRYGDGTVTCAFNTTIEAGASYQMSTPFHLRPPSDSVPGSQAQAVVQWSTKTEWDDFAEVVENDFWGESGTGAPLTLEKVVSSQDAPPQSDLTARNDGGVITLTVSGSREPDLAALGTRITKAGSQVTIKVGAANRGPGTLHPDLFGNNQVPVLVQLPANVTALDVDPRCDDVSGTIYLCATTTTMRTSERQYFSFTLHLAKPSGTAGRVEVADTLPSVTSAGKSAGKKVRAADLANNVARIVVTATGGSGGGLPITGSAVVGTATAGLGLVALGSLLATRRPQRAVYAHAMREPRRGRHRKEPAR